MAFVRVPRAFAAPEAMAPGPFEAAPGGGPAGPSAAAPVLATVAAATAGAAVAQRPYWIAGYGSIVVGFIGGLALYDLLKPTEFKPAAGFDAFAVFYIVAQSLERFFEPVSNFVKGSVGAGQQSTKPEAEAKRDAALTLAYSAPAAPESAAAAQEASTAQATLEQIRANAAILIWGLQSGLSMLLGGAVGLFLLRGVGAQGVPVWADLFVTGIAVGGGSKALHELIKSVQLTKEEKQDPPEVAA